MTTPTPYFNLTAEVQNAMTELDSDNTKYQSAREIFRLEDKVQIFFLTADGKVSTFSAPETLCVFQLEGEGGTFLQVGGWTHPLLNDASPCLQSENGAIMFPDIYSDTNVGSSVGLVLTENVTESERIRLMEVLSEYTALRTQNLLPPDQRLGKVGSVIMRGAELVSQGIEIGADKAGELIEYVTEGAKERLSQVEEDKKVRSVTRTGVEAAKTVTGATVKVSGYVANRVGKLAKKTATYLANKVVDPNVVAKNGKGGQSSGMSVLVDAAKGGLMAYGTIYNGLESSGKILGQRIKDNSVMVVQHKYGLQAGDVFGDACTAAGNAALTYLNIQSLGAKGLVKKTAKETGKSVAKNVVHRTAGTPHVQ